MKKLILLITHSITAFIGFAVGIYTLPILIAPDAPTNEQIKAMQSSLLYSGEFKRDLTDSDALHWGEGILSVSETHISLQGKLAPGPNYILYLSPTFIDTEAEFKTKKSELAAVGAVNTFNNFIVNVPSDVDVSHYNTAIVWCDALNEFISAAQYQ